MFKVDQIMCSKLVNPCGTTCRLMNSIEVTIIFMLSIRDIKVAVSLGFSSNWPHKLNIAIIKQFNTF